MQPWSTESLTWSVWRLQLRQNRCVCMGIETNQSIEQTDKDRRGVPSCSTWSEVSTIQSVLTFRISDGVLLCLA